MGLSSIQWCDYTFNPWIGCRFAVRADGTFIEECFHCYAKTLDDNRYSRTLAPGTKANPVSHWGSGPRHRTKTWGEPLAWNRKARYTVKCPACLCVSEQSEGDRCIRGCNATMQRQWPRPRVFCASLADWLDDENVPIEWFADLLTLIHDTPNLAWLLLTKRPQNWRKRVEAAEQILMERFASTKKDFERWMFVTGWMTGDPPSNVWIGVSAGADQAAALEIPARVHFLSCEPMLRPLETQHAARFDWIPFGGESGNPRAREEKKRPRPCNVGWIRQGVEFCREHGVAPFVKQLGSRPFDSATPEGVTPAEEARWMREGWTKMVGFPGVTWCRYFALKDSHGGDMGEWPAELRVREFPAEVVSARTQRTKNQEPRTKKVSP